MDLSTVGWATLPDGYCIRSSASATAAVSDDDALAANWLAFTACTTPTCVFRVEATNRGDNPRGDVTRSRV